MRAVPEHGTGCQDPAQTSSLCNPLTFASIDNTPPKVNPFHLLTNPDVTSPGPPLPSQIRSFATAQHQTPHPASESLDNPVQGQYQNVTYTSDAGQTPLHITKVTKDTVHIVSAEQLRGENGAGPKKMIQKVSKAFRKPNGDYVETSQVGVMEERRVGHTPIQGAPPSPPASIGEEIEAESEDDERRINDEEEDDMPAPSITVESTEESEMQNGDERRSSIFTSNLTMEPSDLGGSPVKPFAQANRRSSWNSGSSRTGSLAVVRKAKEKEASERERKEIKDLPAIPSGSVDSHTSNPESTLPPPVPRISRRSTNPNPPSPTIAKRSPLVHSQSTFSTPSPTHQTQVMVPGVEGAALDSAILAHSEQLRRERLEKRQKKASAAEAVPQVAESSAQAAARPDRKQTEEAKVLVGNLIGEDHVNYVLMYNMLTGIRIGVSQACHLPDIGADILGVSMSGQDEEADHRRGFHCSTQVLV